MKLELKRNDVSYVLTFCTFENGVRMYQGCASKADLVELLKQNEKLRWDVLGALEASLMVAIHGITVSRLADDPPGAPGVVFVRADGEVFDVMPGTGKRVPRGRRLSPEELRGLKSPSSDQSVKALELAAGRVLERACHIAAKELSDGPVREALGLLEQAIQRELIRHVR